MTYKFYMSNAGAPALDLTPTWAHLRTVAAGTDLSGTAPAITQIGGGWYKFAYTPAEDIVGVIDGGASLPAAERYLPVDTTANDETPTVNLTRIAGQTTVDGMSILRLFEAMAITLDQSASGNGAGTLQYKRADGSIFSVHVNDALGNRTVSRS